MAIASHTQLIVDSFCSSSANRYDHRGSRASERKVHATRSNV
jgi:hypothetical protein